ncbi:hypothetical protein H4Q32_004408 [Labeo rohita]|uniref:Brain acid soluble 1-like protein n=2 Tax=Labeo rohita TaxID=84645 RepID=A0ABQ8MYA0_LABRO|nr:hypothetical protein H4Q32_004408 [Labeo rohita]
MTHRHILTLQIISAHQKKNRSFWFLCLLSVLELFISLSCCLRRGPSLGQQCASSSLKHLKSCGSTLPPVDLENALLRLQHSDWVRFSAPVLNPPPLPRAHSALGPSLYDGALSWGLVSMMVVELRNAKAANREIGVRERERECVSHDSLFGMGHARGKMGGKLSKKKKGYNVNDEKAKEKDAKTEGASAEEGEAPKENKEDAPAGTETNDTAAAAKEATPTAESNSTAPKEEEKSTAPAKKEEPAANANAPKASDAKSSEAAKAEPAKSPDAPPAKAEEKSASAAAPANEKEAAKEPAKDPAPPVATATESKPDAESKKTEAPPAKESAPAEPITTESSPAPNKEQAVAVQD